MTDLALPAGPGATWQNVWATTWRLLTFRASAEELVQLNKRHLLFGLLCTWAVGVGRYWDNPRVHLLQHLGVGSVIYVFVLALLLWVILWPLKPRHWSYFRVVTFVSLVSPPAILYAIPVEHFYSIHTANKLNVLFLALVATWRVALLFFFLRRLGEMSWFTIFVAALLPLTLIVVTLSILNLERVVFNIMGGITEETASDASYEILLLLSYFSIIMFLPILLCYVVLAFQTLTESRRKARESDLS